MKGVAIHAGLLLLAPVRKTSPGGGIRGQPAAADRPVIHRPDGLELAVVGGVGVPVGLLRHECLDCLGCHTACELGAEEFQLKAEDFTALVEVVLPYLRPGLGDLQMGAGAG